MNLKIISYPQILMTYFVLILEFTSTPTRSANREQLCIPMIRTTNYGIKSIIYSGPLLWNQMLRNKLFIDQPKSVSSFKVAVKNYYLGSYSSNKLV